MIRYVKSYFVSESSLTEEEQKRIDEEERQTNLVVKKCPFCLKPTFKNGGCNYMKCSDSEPKSDCSGEWCWQCDKPKYKIIAAKPELGFCNDKSHNSH